jgi:hypothetical protein
MNSPLRITRQTSLCVWLACATAALGALFGARSLGIVLFKLDWIFPNENDSWKPMGLALRHFTDGNGDGLYRSLFFEGHVKFQYPPSSLLPMELLNQFGLMNLLSLNIINAIVFVLNAAVVAVFAWLLFSEPRSTARTSPTGKHFEFTTAHYAAALAFAACWLFHPLTYAFKIGQIQLWIDLAFSLACLFWLLDRKTAAGAAIGFAVALKPQYGLLLVWALLWREWSFVRGFLAMSLPLAALSLWHYGWNNHLEYLDVLSFISRHGESYYANNSVNGIMHRLLQNGPNLEWRAGEFAPYNPYVFAATSIAAVVFLSIPMLLAWLGRDRRPTIADFGVATLCFTIGSPVAWEHHYGIMIPLFLVALRQIWNMPEARAQSWALLALSISWLLSTGKLPNKLLTDDSIFNISKSAFNIVQSHLFFGGLLLIGLLLMPLWSRYGRALHAAPLTRA